MPEHVTGTNTDMSIITLNYGPPSKIVSQYFTSCYVPYCIHFSNREVFSLLIRRQVAMSAAKRLLGKR